MDKTTYGTYEYLPTSNVEGETDQFFVVQQDGTYLINRQVQYVTQVQDTKETLENVQPCTVYDVTPQQFYVNVDNSSELISVSDQFIVPEGSGNLYGNSYLLQPGSNTTNDQMEQDVVVDQYKVDNTQMDVDVDTNINTNTNNYTEITLNDEQYSLLEEKGWILLDINDKVFILDTLGGLRDITNNEKLIEKLKNDNQNYDMEKDSGSAKIENNTSTYENVTHNFPVQQDTVEFVIGNDDAQSDENVQNLSFIISDKEECTSQHIPVEEEKIIITENKNNGINENLHELMKKEQENPDNVKIFLIDDVTSDSKNQDNVLRIKTKLSFKDFPDKIVLGKTINGKKLVARVKRKEMSASEVSNLNTNNASTEVLVTRPKNSTENLSQAYTDNVGLTEMEFRNVLEQSLHGNYEKKLSAKEFEATEVLITQLIQVPSFKTSILSDNLCITKVIQREDLQGNVISSSEPTLITGQIRLINNQWRFVHIPDMLVKLVYRGHSGASNINTERTIDTHILHIHVLETKQKRTDTSIIKTAVSVVKRNLPQNLDVENLKSKKVFACAACASLFETEEELKDHQKIYCANTNKDSNTVSTKNPNNVYYVETGKEKVYCCMQCNAQFKRLSFCKNHIKTHPPKNQESETEQEKGTETQSNTGIYKCKMCPCTYFHSSTLSKHIVTRHIRVI